VKIDAACQRRAGSYANDPAVITKKGVRKKNSKLVNARISNVAPFPLAKKGEGAWLIATKPIKAGKEVFVSYGDDYWETTDIVHKLQNVPVSPLNQSSPNVKYGSIAIVDNSRDEKTGQVKIPRCRLRKV